MKFVAAEYQVEVMQQVMRPNFPWQSASKKRQFRKWRKERENIRGENRGIGGGGEEAVTRSRYR